MPARIWKVVRWCRTQASSLTSQGLFGGRVNEASVSTAAPEHSTLRLNAPGLRWLFATLLLQHISQSQQAALRIATRDVNFLQSNSRCRRYVSDLSNVTPRYLGSEQEARVSLLWLTFSSHLASLLLRWMTANQSGNLVDLATANNTPSPKLK